MSHSQFTKLRQTKNTKESKKLALYEEKKRVILTYVPRFHRLLMDKFPFLKKYFDYSLTEDVSDPMKLTLLRGNKVIYRNF